jgi:hypothetical protein
VSVLFLICVAAVLLSVLVFSALRPTPPTGYYSPHPLPQTGGWISQTPLPVREYERVVYPYSVIPGGVRNRGELAANMSSDRVVAEHFADFSVGQARMVNLEVTRNVYVSYRIRDKVFWTSKTLKIPKGETLITDGRSFARSRCGNRISVEPQAPVSEEEPEPESFDIPVLARAEPGELATLPPSGLELREVTPVVPYFPVPPPKILPYYYRPLFVVSPPPEILVPEPSGWSLLLTGLILLLALSFYKIFREKKANKP